LKKFSTAFLWKTCGQTVEKIKRSGYPQFLHSFSTDLSTGSTFLTIQKIEYFEVIHSFHRPDDDDEFS